MKINLYQVDAFTNTVFKGNPAAICPLDEWLPDELLQKIAAENNLSETAFYITKSDCIEIRWFTPEIEVDLCGHATLATSFVVKNIDNFTGTIIPFYSHRSGNLPVSISGERFIMDFPKDNYAEIPLSQQFADLTDKVPIAVYKGKTDYMLIYPTKQDIKTMSPNLNNIAKLEARGIIVTAKGTSTDFVSRFFAPAAGINEDPVCGSAHTTLTPYWAEQLNKTELSAEQVSQRGGHIMCTLNGDRVMIGGEAVLYLTGSINV